MTPATPESFRRFLREGGWFCEHCDRVVSLPLDCDSPAACPRCRKRCAVWYPPVVRPVDGAVPLLRY